MDFRKLKQILDEVTIFLNQKQTVIWDNWWIKLGFTSIWNSQKTRLLVCLKMRKEWLLVSYFKFSSFSGKKFCHFCKTHVCLFLAWLTFMSVFWTIIVWTQVNYYSRPLSTVLLFWCFGAVGLLAMFLAVRTGRYECIFELISWLIFCHSTAIRDIWISCEL